MPKGEIKVRSESWWVQKTSLEKDLLACVAIAIIVITILIALLAIARTSSSEKPPSPGVCSTPTCITESAKILQNADPQAKPCENLYKKACGKFLADSHGDEKLATFNRLSEQFKREILEMYKIEGEKEDHRMVKAARNLFKACLNQTEIARDNLRTIKESIKVVGGWPVIEGAKWSETNFDWVRSSAVLRKLGYYYAIFVDVQIDGDPNNARIPMLKIAPPNLWDLSSRNFDKIDFMIDVAEAFGALNRKEASLEMTQTNAFLLQMQFEAHAKQAQISYRKYTIEEYQKKFGEGLVDWLIFINNIVGRTARMTKDDHVLFPPPELFKSWFEFVSKTPKRTLANYLVWKVIEDSIPYLTEDLRERKGRLATRENRDIFCLEEVQRRFVPDPVSVMYARKFLPEEKRGKIEDILSGIKREIIEMIQKFKWADEENRKSLVERVETVGVIIGQPGNYSEDKILNDIDVDMAETKNAGFLSLLAQASRNRQTKLYNQIKSQREDSLSEKWYVKTGDFPFYSETDNVLYVPTAITKYYFYEEVRPFYLNYGTLGTQLGYQLINVLAGYFRRREIWSNSTNFELNKIEKCLREETQSDKFKVESLPNLAFPRLAYYAYQKIAEKMTPESKLIGLDFTPNQLFWLSSLSVTCHPGSNSDNPFAEYVQASAEFSRDFGCPNKPDYLEKCHFL